MAQICLLNLERHFTLGQVRSRKLGSLRVLWGTLEGALENPWGCSKEPLRLLLEPLRVLWGTLFENPRFKVQCLKTGALEVVC